MLKKIITITAAILLTALGAFAQGRATVYGSVYFNGTGGDYDEVTISIEGSATQPAKPDQYGSYTISIPTGKEVVLIFDNFSDKKRVVIPALKPGQKYKLNVTLSTYVKGTDIVITGGRKDTLPIRVKDIQKFAGPGGFEMILKTLPGVSSGNELSSQYNVRGGNFDENLVYVNGMEVFRPQLVRAGQQEGLSFINPAMIKSISFSAGGFEAKYGDKLSSVLDVEYKTPDSLAGSVLASFLGFETHVEGTGKDIGWGSDSINRFKFVIGLRYRSNGYVLSSQDVQGRYNPRFYDFQTLLSYDFSKTSSISWLFNGASNQYLVEPQSQETSFGTATTALQLFVGFAGRDGLNYTTVTNSLKYKLKPSNRTTLTFMGAAYNINEREIFDVEGAYRLSQLDNRLGSSTFGQPIATLGTGYFINHGRNELSANIYSLSHRGRYAHADGALEWGAKYQIEGIDDKYREWRYEDSAGFNISPIDTIPGQITLSSYVSSKNTLNSHRWMGYVQNSSVLNGEAESMKLTYGVRANYWSVNDEWVVSPRVQYTFEPNKDFNRGILFDSLKRKDITIKLATGYYYQPPFYRELRNFEGQLNKNIKAQRSIHFLAGAEYQFRAWGGRLFKFTSDVYYKKLDYMIPYLIDNVRIRYYAENSSRGYAAGTDFRINGEFIEGLESWLSLSFLKTDEKIGYIDTLGEKRETGYLRRPTDRRFGLSILFQDELKTDSTFKVHLNLVYGSNLPFYLKDSRYIQGYEIPAYRRVDVGFSKEYIYTPEKETTKNGVSRVTPSKHNFAKPFKSVWMSLEVFNLFQINNTASYLWVKDLNNNTYGVPNYLTGRRLNLKLLLTL